MLVFIVLGTTGETCEIFPGSQEKKVNTKFMDLPFCITRKENAVWAKVLKCTVNIFN